MWCTFLQELELGPNWARLRLILSNSGPLTQGGWSWSAGCDEDWLPPMPGTRALASIGGWQLSDWQTGHRGRTGAPLPDTDSTQQGRGSGKFKSWLIPYCQKSRSTWIYFLFLLFLINVNFKWKLFGLCVVSSSQNHNVWIYVFPSFLFV